MNHTNMQILPNQLNNSTNIIHDLIDFMMTNKNLCRCLKHKFPTNVSNKMSQKGKTSVGKQEVAAKDKVYKPSHKDSLFWCFYILKHGYFNYEVEISNHFVVEKNEKFSYIDKLKEIKPQLKIFKIKPFTELEESLSHSECISVKTFFALCVYERINVLLIYGRKIYELIINETKPLNIIHKTKDGIEHYIEESPTPSAINNYYATHYKVDSYETSLKAASTYKLDELKDLCVKFNIVLSNDIKYTKKDIYALLVQQF